MADTDEGQGTQAKGYLHRIRSILFSTRTYGDRVKAAQKIFDEELHDEEWCP